jgi:hypothetical protein
LVEKAVLAVAVWVGSEEEEEGAAVALVGVVDKSKDRNDKA